MCKFLEAGLKEYQRLDRLSFEMFEERSIGVIPDDFSFDFLSSGLAGSLLFKGLDWFVGMMYLMEQRWIS